MTNQLRRSAASISANLAEGAGRGTDRDFRRFVKIATGSAFEYETHVTLAQDVGLLEPADATNLLAEISIVKRMLHGLAQSLC
jgi:four helix bundle protein